VSSFQNSGEGRKRKRADFEGAQLNEKHSQVCLNRRGNIKKEKVEVYTFGTKGGGGGTQKTGIFFQTQEGRRKRRELRLGEENSEKGKKKGLVRFSPNGGQGYMIL